MRGFEHISVDPEICGGMPCVEGTRIPVHVVLSHLAAGESAAEILEAFPSLRVSDISACLEYAASVCASPALSG